MTWSLQWHLKQGRVWTLHICCISTKCNSFFQISNRTGAIEVKHIIGTIAMAGFFLVIATIVLGIEIAFGGRRKRSKKEGKSPKLFYGRYI